MSAADSGQYVRDALRLGIDLAPANSRIAILTVNMAVVSEISLTDISSTVGRNRLNVFINNIQNQGSTNFAPGYERALEILYDSQAPHRRIIFFGDFDEGGFNAGSHDDEREVAILVDSLAEIAKERGVIIDSIMWRDAPSDSITASHFLALPETTGGTSFWIHHSNQTPSIIQEIYFENFIFGHSVFSVFSETSQTINIPMPIDAMRRVRIFVSSATPPREFSVTHAGVIQHGERSRTYAIADILYPTMAGVNVTITPGDTGIATIYTLFEFNPIELVLTTEHHYIPPRLGMRATQVSTIHAELVDSTTGFPVLTYPFPNNASYSIQLTSQNGSELTDYRWVTPNTLVVNPYVLEDFGAHRITAILEIEGITFSPITEIVYIPDIRPEIIPIEPYTYDWRLIGAIIIAIALILLALLVFVIIRRREKVVPVPIQPEPKKDYRFHGKLKICPLIVDGGNQEIRPFEHKLKDITEKRIALHSVFDTESTLDEKTDADLRKIILTAGPNESILINNKSRAIIRVMGRDYGYRDSNIQLFYGQKCYIVFERDQNELEVIYKETKPA
jgi:hypothetical protein